MSETVVRGVVAPGLGKAAGFTDLPWVWQQFAEKLDLHVWPGTLNVRVTEPPSQVAWGAVRRGAGIAIVPPDPATCGATCFHVVVNDWIRGAAVVPQVPGYPEDQIEIVAAEHVRSALRLADASPVVLRFVPSWSRDLRLVKPPGVQA